LAAGGCDGELPSALRARVTWLQGGAPCQQLLHVRVKAASVLRLLWPPWHQLWCVCMAVSSWCCGLCWRVCSRRTRVSATLAATADACGCLASMTWVRVHPVHLADGYSVA
jgi:hypothetical protein